jgi:hypothetical protein
VLEKQDRLSEGTVDSSEGVPFMKAKPRLKNEVDRKHIAKETR